MKIFMIIESLGVGGTERRLAETLIMISKDKEFEIELILLNKDVFYKSVNKLNSFS